MVSREVSALIKDNASHTKPYAKKVAVVGGKGVVRVIADSIGRLTRGTPQAFFNTVEEVQDWLISTGQKTKRSPGAADPSRELAR